MTDCALLQLTKEGYDYVMSSAERKIFNDKMSFLRSLPEFKHLSLPRSKLVHLCENLNPISCIKNKVIFKEGDANQNVYFVRSGELQVTKKVQMPTLDNEMDDVQKLFEDPSYIKEK